MKMIAGSCYIPHLKKHRIHNQGDDACFVSPDQQVVGVADGVGGWWARGVDPGEYSREIMRHSNNLVQSANGQFISPLDLLREAYRHTISRGSSTACIVALKDQFIHAANVGDSGFIVIREGAIVCRSLPQQVRFNSPYQLGNEAGYETPDHAEVFEVEVQPFDVVVVGTDGLFDNMFADSLANVVPEYLDQLAPENLAARLARVAAYISSSRNITTPFSIASQTADRDHKGGKLDDITVVVGMIVDSNTA